jgi:hypothetical protein
LQASASILLCTEGIYLHGQLKDSYFASLMIIFCCLLGTQEMLDQLDSAGLGPQQVEYLWQCYEKARQAEEKAGFKTGIGSTL